ncbi:acetyltransferase [Microthyrium microscopicum]|uniref:Acetyltransferase n=1 Tax=Microthyrium microscopicum TaxID=703497 RepID=A0A6A6UR79_9PEZI|nr:acetyltransferase [Microthyrium microscopicum]
MDFTALIPKALKSKAVVAPARSAQDIADIKILFTAYTESLGIDLTYQNYSAELSSLPGRYAPPTGELLLARDQDGKAIGCVAVRPLPLPHIEDCCEMKRLYVTPAGRGLGLGTSLMNAVMDAAKSLGYKNMVLDTLDTMAGAQRLYTGAGFEYIEAYYETPIKNTVFMRKTF